MYSNVIRLRDSKGNSRQTLMSFFQIVWNVDGHQFLKRTSSVTPFKEIARLASIFSFPKRRIFGSNPEVETVMRRCEKIKTILIRKNFQSLHEILIIMKGLAPFP